MSSEDYKEESRPRDQLDEKKKKWVKVPMRYQPPEDRIKNFDEVAQGFTKDQVIEEANRCMLCKRTPCQQQCPIDQDIKGYLMALRDGDYDKALEVIMDKNPFPASIGRVCPQFCAKACLRGKKGDPICIAALKRAASDFGNYEVKVAPPSGKSVAIVGAGPAGLSAAYDLARWGHKVTVFEREEVKGGMLVSAIPAYRLPKDEVAKDVARIERMGVAIKTGVQVGKDITLKELKRDFDAVLIAIGTHKPRFMGIGGEDKDGVTHVLTFLHDIQLDKQPWVGERIAVIGGGSSAMDAVRTAKRLGKEAWLVYRRDREQMPAHIDEVKEGEEEDITFHYLTNPTYIKGDDNVKAMECIKMRLGEPDASGRARPIPIEGSEFEIGVDMVIEAISQAPDTEGLADESIKFTRRHTYETDDDGKTTEDKVFAGGDCVRGPSTIVQAIGSARKASVGVHRFLMGASPPGYEAKGTDGEST